MKFELSNRKNDYSDYDFFEEAMHDFFPGLYRRNSGHKYMRTDIKETDDGYEMEVELPGMDKKDIALELSDGYLNISVSRSDEENSGKGNYIHRERSFSCKRSYYVGDIRKEDVKASYDNGILKVFIPKEKREESSSSRIDID